MGKSHVLRRVLTVRQGKGNGHLQIRCHLKICPEGNGCIRDEQSPTIHDVVERPYIMSLKVQQQPVCK
jgi:hypothetical protein